MNKELRSKAAHAHYEYVKDAYAEEIEESYNKSTVYPSTQFDAIEEGSTEANISVVDMTTEKAVNRYGDNCGVLNFASFTRPGGGFLKGSIAQEEAICGVSTLYNILERYKPLYEANYKKETHHMYEDWAIYTPNVVFTFSEVNVHNNDVTVNVVTCPAPNRGRNTSLSEEKYQAIMESRIKYVLDIFEHNKNTKIILGAFGCGVFKNNPSTVAKLFKKVLSKYKYSFTDVIFAIPKGENLDKFKEVFN